MKTRVRSQDGATTDIDKSEGVEILDDEGLLAAVVLTDRKGTVHFLTPGDVLFNAYIRSNRLRPAKVHKHEPFPVEQPV